MNFGDSEIVVSIMQKEGYFYTEKAEEADIILNEHNETLRDFILHDLDRSATYIQSRGMYSSKEKEMIFLVVPNKDVPLVQRIIKDVDPTAFIVVTDAYDTFGEGFKPLPEKDEIQNI